MPHAHGEARSADAISRHHEIASPPGLAMTAEPSMRTACVIALTFLVLAASVRAGPVVTVSVSPAVISQGGAVVVTVTGDLPDGTLQVRLAGRIWPLYRESNRWRT